MKRTLLSVFALLGVSAMAQQANVNWQAVKSKPFYQKVVKAKQLEMSGAPIETGIQQPPVHLLNNQGVKAPAALNKIKIGTSYNQYSVLLEEQSCLTAHQALGVIGFTHRQCSTYPSGTYPSGTPSSSGSGLVQMSFSTDMGATWDTSLVITSDGNRYPSGGIYNPNGNANINNAFAVVAGPSLIDPNTLEYGGGWVSDYAASARFDNTNIYEEYFGNTMQGASQGTPTFFTLRNYMYVTDNGKAYVGGDDFNYDGSVYDHLGFNVLTGTFNPNTNKFDWTVNSFSHTFSQDASGSDNHSQSGMAWSQDGMTGYVVFIARDAIVDVKSPQPIVYKTEDGGQTWNMLPIFDFSNIQLFQDSLPNVQGKTYARPYFSPSEGMDFAVDAYGNLHIITTVIGAYSDHPDSLDYIYDTPWKGIYDVYINKCGNWDATYVGTLGSVEVQDTDGCADNGLGWTARIQAGRSADGTKIFAQWLDTDPMLSTSNCYPDIHGWGFDVVTGMKTANINWTTGTSYTATNKWMYVSNVAIDNGNGSWTVPTTVSQAGSSDLSPMTHYYMDGITYPTDSFYIQVYDPTPLTASLSTTQANCGVADGTASVFVTAGVIPYSYTWNNGATTSTITGLNIGSVSVTVTDGYGCSESFSGVITNAGAPSVTITAINVSCPGGNDGEAFASNTVGGTAPYSYAWSNGSTTGAAVSLTAGVYSLTVTDANSCANIAMATITEPAPINIDIQATDISCNGLTDGSVAVNSVTGGTPGYTYAWNTGSTAMSISNLGSGAYTVTVTDANNCTAVASATVVEPAALTASIASSDAACNGGNGSITVTTSGGTTPYTYNWSGTSATTDVVNVPAGTYSVTVVDNSGCTFSGLSATITEPSAITITGNATDATDQPVGAIDITVTGGTSPYTYSWTGGATSEDLSNLSQGTYTVVVTDANGCTATATYTLSGTVATFNVTGETAISVYPNPNKGAFNVVFDNVSAGNYVVKVTNTLGQTVFTDNVKATSGSALNINLNAEKGIYFLNITSDAYNQVIKLVVE